MALAFQLIPQGEIAEGRLFNVGVFRKTGGHDVQAGRQLVLGVDFRRSRKRLFETVVEAEGDILLMNLYLTRGNNFPVFLSQRTVRWASRWWPWQSVQRMAWGSVCDNPRCSARTTTLAAGTS